MHSGTSFPVGKVDFLDLFPLSFFEFLNALGEEELVKLIDEVIAKVNPTSQKDMGLVMKEINPLVKGKADMKVVSTMIKDKLANL